MKYNQICIVMYYDIERKVKKMKRILSVMLAVLMVLSVCSSLAFSVSAVEEVVEGNAVKYSVKTDGFKNGQITFDVYLAPEQDVRDSVVTFRFNTDELAVVKAGPATVKDSDGNENDVVSGLHEHGVPESCSSAYTFGYINSNDNGYKVGSKEKHIYTITFKTKNSNVTTTSIDVLSGPYNSVTKIKSYQNMATFDAPVVKAVSLRNGAVVFNWSAVSGVSGYAIYKLNGTDFSKVATVDSKTTSYTDYSVKNNVTYTYGVAATDSKGNSGFYKTFEVTYIAAPKTSFEIVKTGINVSWEKIDGAEKYIVYKATMVNGNWSDWSNVQTVEGTRATWVDTAVKKGETYRYAAAAVVNGIETAHVNDSSIKYVPQITSLDTPTVTAKNTAKGVTVSWNSIANAESYIVYRSIYNTSTKKWAKWSVIKSGVTETTYADTTVKLGTTYKYTVRAVNGDIKSGYEGTEALKYNVIPTVKIANTASGIKVSWSTAANATGYTVYRSQYDTKAKKWSGWKNMGTAKANKTSWVDKKVTSGVNYKYTVRALNGKVASSYKASSTLIFLTQPTVKFANAAAGVKVSWSKVKGATGYTVYRSELKDGKWSSWSNRGTAKSNKSSWVDKKVTSGVTYKYTVRAVNGKVKSSYTDTKGLNYLAQPTVQVKAVSNGINVAWSQSAGATGFTVYRSQYNAQTKKWSGWKSMGTAKASKSNWTDKKAAKGVKYKYTVRAVNADTGAKSTYVASKVISR